MGFFFGGGGGGGDGVGGREYYKICIETFYTNNYTALLLEKS